MVDYLSAVIMRQYGKEVLSIFELYYQDLAKDVVWIEGIPMIEEEKDLENALREELDWLELDTKEVEASNKRHCPTLENDISIDSFTTKDFGFKIVPI